MQSSRVFSLIVFINVLLLIFFTLIYMAPFKTQATVAFSQKVEAAMVLYLFFVLIRSVVLIILSFAELYFRKVLPTLTKFPFVTVIIPCFNEEAVIENAIRSIAKLNYPNFEILVVDDGSTDNTLEKAKSLEHLFNIRIISKENGGKADALNRGCAESLGDYILCMDADSRMDENVLMLAMAYYDANPRLGAVAGSVVINKAPNILTKFQKFEYIVGLNFHKTAQSFLSCVTIVPGPIGVFKKSAFLYVGGYHTDTYAEDADLTARLLMHGYDVNYCPEMICDTEAPDNLQDLISQRYRWSRGILQVIAKHAKWLLMPHKNLRNFLIMFYMLIESIYIPTINFVFVFLTIYQGLNYGLVQILGIFFVGLTILDIAITLFSIVTEKTHILMLVLAAMNRLTYGLFIEIIRFYSFIDELLRIPMRWNKLNRKGI